LSLPSRKLTELDAAQWARYAGQVRPLRDRSVQQAPANGDHADAVPLPSRNDIAPISRPSPKQSPPGIPLGIGGAPPGVDAATWRRFERGQLGGTRKLDLHSMTARHAFAVLREFLRAAQADRVRSVEIVTGRGSAEGAGVLRRELPMWLNLPDIRPMILAASHPHISNAMHARVANVGSVRLLLRRPRA
jgi:DNA-nicking Smr family endonuclease